jgi:hypothetical protein
MKSATMYCIERLLAQGARAHTHKDDAADGTLIFSSKAWLPNKRLVFLTFQVFTVFIQIFYQ